MRASISDRRLEAIAGPPLLMLDRKANRLRIPQGASIIFVGEYLPTEETMQYAIAFRNDSVGIGDSYVVADKRVGGALYSANVPYTWGRIGGRIWCHGIFEHPDNAAPVGIGSHYAGASVYQWAGELRAAVYDRTLTEGEALAVARQLALSLSLSLSLSG